MNIRTPCSYAEIIFLASLVCVLIIPSYKVWFICVSILLVLNGYIFSQYFKIEPFLLIFTYLALSPFRRFISLHQPIYFPTALPLEIIIVLLVISSLDKFRKQLLVDPVILIFILFFAWGFIEVFNPLGSIEIGLLGFRNRTLAAILFLVCYLNVKTKTDIDRMISIMQIVLLVVAAYGIFHFFFPTNAELQVYQANINQSNFYMSADSQIRRAFSTMTSPGAFGVAMFMLLSINIYKYASKQHRNNLIVIVVFGVNLIALLLSGSRSSMVAALTFAYIYYIMQFNNMKRIKFTAFAFLVILLFFLLIAKFGPADVSGRLFGVFNPLAQESSFVSRLGLWDLLYNSITTMPLGYGNGATGIEIGLELNTVKLPDIVTILTDNEYVTLLYEQGWIGCMLYLLFILTIVHKTLHAFSKSDGNSKMLYCYIVAMSIVYLLLGVPIQLSQIFPINVFMWILWGASYKLARGANYA